MPITGVDPTTGLPLANGQKAAPNPYAPSSAPAAPAAPPQGQAAPPFATTTPGGSPKYGTQSPTMFGTGTYTAPLYAINDQAITGAPNQGAGSNYGINSVWDNLNKELAAAPHQGAGMATATTGGPASYQAATGQAALAHAAQGGYATAGPVGLSTAGNSLAQQQALAHTLDVQANGGGTSAADLQLRAGAQQNLANQLAAMGSQRGVTNAALMNRTAANAAAASVAQLNQTEGIQRAQETAAAQQAEGSVLGAQGAQASGINSMAAGLAQQTALANAENAQQSTVANTENAQQIALANAAAENAMTGGNLSAVNAANLGNAQLSQQQELANLGYSNTATEQNQQMQLANAQLLDNQTNAVLGAQTSIGEANKASSLADQQLQLQQLIAANQVNEQGYASSAGANANLTGAVVGGIAGLGAAGINALGRGAAASGGGASSPGDPTGGISLNAAGTPNVTYGGQLPTGPGSTWASSDENVKAGVENGNPMLRSFLQNYRESTQPKINVTEGSGFRNPTTGSGAGAGGSAGGGGIGSTIGGILGGIAGSLGGPAGAMAGSAVGGTLGGAIGNGIDPATAGGGSVMTNPGSGVTVDESGWGQMPSGMALSDERQKVKSKWHVDVGQAQDVKPVAPWHVDMGAPVFDTPKALSDENEKDAVTSGNRGMQAFLKQATAQTQAQNNQGATNNSFMQTGAPPSSQVDTQLPHGSSMPPFMQGSGGVGYGMPSAPTGGTVSGGGVTNFGGYQGASMNPWGGVGPPPNSPLSLQYDQPVNQSAVNSLAGAQTRPTSLGGFVPTSSTHPQSPASPAMTPAQQSYIDGFSSYLSGANKPQPPFAGLAGAAASGIGAALSDEDEKVKATDARDPEKVQDMLSNLQAYRYKYKDPSAPGAAPGERMGVMAQDIAKSPLGRQYVANDPDGHKMVNYGAMGVPGQNGGVLLAASAMLNQRLDEHESMLKHLMSSRST